MISKDFLAEVRANMQRQMAEDFQSQNFDLLDTVFEIEGKKLYAHKLLLSAASPTLKTMLSDRWNTNKNEAIAINGYGYEIFKKLLNFIYSGKCKLTDANIFTMLDMAEFYQINHLKALCDLYLSKKEIDTCNVFQLMEISSKYSLTQTKESIRVHFILNFSKIVESDKFLEADESMMEEIVTYASKSYVKREELFQANNGKAFYKCPERTKNGKWKMEHFLFHSVDRATEHQATKKEETLAEENFTKDDVIKAEIEPFLPYVEFKKMQLDFLNTFVVKRGFIFSDDELYDILTNAKPEPPISDSLKQRIYGSVLSYSKVTQPRRPYSVYMFWLAENRARLTKHGMGITDVAIAARKEWGQLQDKAIWEQLAADDKKRYERELMEYYKNN